MTSTFYGLGTVIGVDDPGGALTIYNIDNGSVIISDDPAEVTNSQYVGRVSPRRLPDTTTTTAPYSIVSPGAAGVGSAATAGATSITISDF